MFVLSKMFWAVSNPISLSLCFAISAFCLLCLRRYFAAMGILLTCIFVIFISSFTTVGAYFLQNLEERYIRPGGLAEAPTCIITLGGGILPGVSAARGGYEFDTAATRYIETVKLAKRYPEAKLILSGGDPSLGRGQLSEAKIVEKMLLDFDIDRTRIILDEASRNTFENAENVRDIMANASLDRCLLVTSAFHMPRAMAVFHHLGVQVVPWPTDYRTTGSERITVNLMQADSGLFALAIKENIGIIVYRWLGQAG